MKTANLSAAALDRRIYIAQKMGDIAKAMNPEVQPGKTARVDDSALLKSMARDAAEQKAHTGAAAAAKTSAKTEAQASTHPQLAIRAPSPALTLSSVRVAPTSSASSAKARGFADRARNAAK